MLNFYVTVSRTIPLGSFGHGGDPSNKIGYAFYGANPQICTAFAFIRSPFSSSLAPRFSHAWKVPR